MSESQDFSANHESKKLAKLAIFLRVYGVVSLLLFSTLLLGFLVRSPLFADPTLGCPGRPPELADLEWCRVWR
jgi:hypothetical protein